MLKSEIKDNIFDISILSEFDDLSITGPRIIKGKLMNEKGEIIAEGTFIANLKNAGITDKNTLKSLLGPSIYKGI